jgi:sulfate permease, SulP family
VLRGVLEAVLISLLVLLYELNHPRIVAGHPASGLLAIRPEERLYFANVRNVCDRIAALIAAEQPPPRVVLLDLGAANDVEVTALEQLERLAEDLHEHGMALWLAVPSQRPQEVIGRAAQLLGRASLTTDSGPIGVRVFPRLADAVAAFEAQAQPGRGR